MTRPNVTVGQGVKVYEGPDYGRRDAVVTRANNSTGVIEARLVKGGRIVKGLRYSADIGTGPAPTVPYWTELPDGYVPGSEGH